MLNAGLSNAEFAIRWRSWRRCYEAFMRLEVKSVGRLIGGTVVVETLVYDSLQLRPRLAENAGVPHLEGLPVLNNDAARFELNDLDLLVERRHEAVQLRVHHWQPLLWWNVVRYGLVVDLHLGIAKQHCVHIVLRVTHGLGLGLRSGILPRSSAWWLLRSCSWRLAATASGAAARLSRLVLLAPRRLLGVLLWSSPRFLLLWFVFAFLGATSWLDVRSRRRRPPQGLDELLPKLAVLGLQCLVLNLQQRHAGLQGEVLLTVLTLADCRSLDDLLACRSRRWLHGPFLARRGRRRRRRSGLPPSPLAS
mmetsp:Transcript_8242/g.18003  ORF Transcript_8242/g.18003 Transcript_8242/m.18003 type:complete len:307 (-) Transcript_8242:85-1005(-)